MTLLEALQTVIAASGDDYMVISNGDDRLLVDVRQDVDEGGQEYLVEHGNLTVDGREVPAAWLTALDERGYRIGDDHDILLVPCASYDAWQAAGRSWAA